MCWADESDLAVVAFLPFLPIAVRYRVRLNFRLRPKSWVVVG
jgi:hypothetical protein